eukprot:comp21960_c0_seq3/m.50161 comp21960_c0_seq3/g.50161  ORF comp21960_c0_seq3/g.50161 comp21960_c0_seq3/m.50161 type:complete len:680 (+) comp21960_c0_seq3:33-2072(+)
MQISKVPSGNLRLGLLAGLGACFLWSFIFSYPDLAITEPGTDAETMTSGSMTVARFFFFAVVCTVSAFAHRANAVRFWNMMGPRDKVEILMLSFLGFWFCTLLMLVSVAKAGTVLTSLVVGLLPITIPITSRGLAGNFRLPWKVGLGLVCILVGLLVLVFGDTHKNTDHEKNTWVGVLALVGVLGTWTAYSIRNTAFLRKFAEPGIKELLIDFIGIVSFTIVFLLSLLPPSMSSYSTDYAALSSNPHLLRFLGAAALIGIGSTWLAYRLWNTCSVNCPCTISGPLCVGETIFALILSFLLNKRLPYLNEIASMIFFCLGGYVAIREEVRIEAEASANTPAEADGTGLENGNQIHPQKNRNPEAELALDDIEVADLPARMRDPSPVASTTSDAGERDQEIQIVMMSSSSSSNHNNSNNNIPPLPTLKVGDKHDAKTPSSSAAAGDPAKKPPLVLIPEGAPPPPIASPPPAIKHLAPFSWKIKARATGDGLRASDFVTEDAKKAIKARFEAIDADGSGAISATEYSQYCRAQGVPNIDPVWFQLRDLNKDGKITMDEFTEVEALDILEKEALEKNSDKGLVSMLTAAELGEARSIFNTLDLDGSGTLTRQEVESAFEIQHAHLYKALTSPEAVEALKRKNRDTIKELFSTADHDHNGTITWTEYIASIAKTIMATRESKKN